MTKGTRVTIRKCEARAHGDNDGCVCALIGTVAHVKGLHETPFAGTPSYELFGSDKRVRAGEVEITPIGEGVN